MTNTSNPPKHEIKVQAHFNDVPEISWTYDGFSEHFGLPAAAAFVDGLTKAASLAEVQTALIKALGGQKLNIKGFGSYKATTGLGLQVIQLLEHELPNLPSFVSVSYAPHLAKAVVVFRPTPFIKVVLTPSDAQIHARTILQAVEAAQAHAYLYYFLQDEAAMTTAHSAALVRGFSRYRQSSSIADLIEKHNSESAQQLR